MQKSENSVYIAGIKTLLPNLHTPEEAVDVLYSPELAGERINRIAKKVAKTIGIKNRPSVINTEKFPEIIVDKEEFSPLNWGTKIISKLTGVVDKKEIGFLSVSYNISSNEDFLPNLASKLTMKNNLNPDTPPQEIAYYGCGASVFSLESAFNYCREHDRAAIVYSFDQCSMLANPTYDTKHPDFKENMRTCLLFSDGAAGVLLIPESMRKRFKKPLMKITDVVTDFKCGESVRMKNGNLFLGMDIKDTMPELVKEKLIEPLFKKHNLQKESIDEWSIHQGGIPILERFREEQILGLTEEQIKNSKDLFIKYGNFSAPSMLFILDSFFNNPRKERMAGKNGMAVAFGAGYYIGSLLYRWENDD